MTEIKKEEIKPGMTIKVYQKIKEEGKEKTHILEGLVLSRKHKNEPGGTITLRRTIDGVGVEWILPLFSPKIEKIELIKEGRARRAKLYYIREKSQREVKAKLRSRIKQDKRQLEKTGQEIQNKNQEKQLEEGKETNEIIESEQTAEKTETQEVSSTEQK